MRCRLRLPLYGGVMVEMKKREFGDANHKTSQMLGGGPIERAIRQDLISLRRLFYEAIENNIRNERDRDTLRRESKGLCTTRTSKRRAGAKDRSELQSHKPDGYSYQIFKEVFKEAKFGIIFTRAAPKNPRMDREAFVQLVFSSTLSFLKDAIQSMEKCTCGETNIDNDEQNRAKRRTRTNARSTTNELQNQQKQRADNEPDSFFDASFAIYALYTLYHTNPAPHVPIDHDCDNKADDQKYDSIHQHSKKSSTMSTEKHSLTPREAKLLTTLPIGLTDTATESEARFYRRSYHSPIRISFQSMQLLIKLRKISLVHMDNCRMNQYSSLEKKHCSKKVLEKNSSDSSDEDNPTDKLTREKGDAHSQEQMNCTCSLANDFITLVDRLITEQCFYFCEYDGPVSVESYCGIDEYVRSTVLVEKGKNYVDTLTVDNHQEQENNDEVHVDINIAHRSISSLLNLEELQGSLDKYHTLMGDVSMAIQMKSKDSYKNKHTIKNQLSLIENTIKPIMRERHRQQNVSTQKNIEVMLNNTDENNVGNSEAMIDEDDTIEEFGSPEISTDNRNPSDKLDSDKSIHFIYPETFSKGLKKGLNTVLDTIILLEKEDKSIVATEHLKRQKETSLQRRCIEDDEFFDVDSFFGDEDFNQNEDTHDEDFDLNSIATMETEHIGGTKNAALQLLLSKAMEISSPSVRKKVQKRKSKTSKFVQNGSKHKKMRSRRTTEHAEDDRDELVSLRSSYSAATSVNIEESGKTALRVLLNQAKDGQERSRPRSKRKNSSNAISKSQFRLSNQHGAENGNISVCSKSSVSTNLTNNIGTGTIAIQHLLESSSKNRSSSTISEQNQKLRAIPGTNDNETIMMDVNDTEIDSVSHGSKSSITTNMTCNIGSGAIALQQLLKTTTEKQRNTFNSKEKFVKSLKARKKIAEMKPDSFQAKSNNDAEDSESSNDKSELCNISIAPSESGQAALKSLLNKACDKMW